MEVWKSGKVYDFFIMYSFILVLPLSYPSITPKAFCGPNLMRTSLYFQFRIIPSYNQLWLLCMNQSKFHHSYCVIMLSYSIIKFNVQ